MPDPTVPAESAVKECATCHELLPMEAFSPRKGVPDGRTGRCRGCFNAYARERHRRLGSVRAITVRQRWQIARTLAERRGLAFELTEAQYAALLAQPCRYCGGAPVTGVDRSDTTRGYEAENVVPACGLCNYWKSVLPPEVFRQHLERVYRHYVLAQPQSAEPTLPWTLTVGFGERLRPNENQSQ